MLNRPHSITATVEIHNGAEGVLVAQGGSSGGYSLYLKDHKLHYAYNYLGVQQFRLRTDSTSREGRHELRFEFEPTGAPDLAHGKGTPARAQLYVDGQLAAKTDLPVTIPLDIGITEGLTCGRDNGSSVTTDYESAVHLHRRAGKGRGRRVGGPDRGHAAAMSAVMAHQ